MDRHTLERSLLTFADLDKNITLLTLSFRNPKMEQKYSERRIDTLVPVLSFRVLSTILLLLIVARKIELLVFSLYDVSSGASIVARESLNVGLMLLACLLEAGIYFIQSLRIIRGAIGMLYIFFTIAYFSAAVSDRELVSVPM